MTQDKARKTATRQRMAETGEPYSVARHAVESEYSEATVDDAAGNGAVGDSGGEAGLSAQERGDQMRGSLLSRRRSWPNGFGSGPSRRTRRP